MQGESSIHSSPLNSSNSLLRIKNKYPWNAYLLIPCRCRVFCTLPVVPLLNPRGTSMNGWRVSPSFPDLSSQTRESENWEVYLQTLDGKPDKVHSLHNKEPSNTENFVTFLTDNHQGRINDQRAINHNGIIPNNENLYYPFTFTTEYTAGRWAKVSLVSVL